MSREAMKQALEALEVEQTVYLRAKLPEPEYLTKAIIALSQAIAEAEGISLMPIKHPIGQPADGDINPDSLEEIEIDLPDDEPFGYFQYSMHMDAWVQNRDSDKGVAFYTRPQPAAQWVGLTDKERNQLWRDVVKWGDPSHDDVDLMKAIEQALKEKNNG